MLITHTLRLLLGHQAKPYVFQKAHDCLPDVCVPNLGIYVHVPFCETLCPFCPYYKVKYDESKVSPYLEALLREIETVAERSFPERREITSIYFGGGSPALLASDLHKITQKIDRYFHVSGNTGIELHPRDVHEGLPKTLTDAGFDMVSLGVQSFTPRLLKALGRSDEDPLVSLAILSGHGFQAIDVDLIFGIPGQTEEDLRRDFLTAAENRATQISTYPFIDFSYAQNSQKPLGRESKKRLLSTLLKTADEAGFVRTSVWTFGRKGSPKYSSITRDNFLGFGPSATSLGKDAFKVNTFSLDAYTESTGKGEVPTALQMTFSTRTRGLYWLFWNCYNGDISEAVYKELFDRSLRKDFGPSLAVGTALGILQKTEEGWLLTKRGSYLFHIVEQEYTHQYIDKTWSHAMKTPWPESMFIY